MLRVTSGNDRTINEPDEVESFSDARHSLQVPHDEVIDQSRRQVGGELSQFGRWDSRSGQRLDCVGDLVDFLDEVADAVG